MPARGEFLSLTDERLLARVEFDTNGGCWLWSGGANKQGYGNIYDHGKPVCAHRASFAHFRGPISPGAYVCHRCDTPSCINPDHLFLGTPADNVRDCASKGRRSPTLVGEAARNSRLTEADALEIRRIGRERLLSHREIANQFGVSQSLVSGIIRRERWKHIPEQQESP